MEIDKLEIYNQIQNQVNERINRLQDIIKSTQDAANQDTRSSAGDKYETHREMMQAEKEKAVNQLNEAFKLKKVISQISVKKTDKVELGALLQTNIGMLYLSIPIGELNINNHKIICISMVSPLGKVLSGLSEKSEIPFNGKPIFLEKII